MTTYFSLHDFVRVAKEHPKAKGWRISMTDIQIQRNDTTSAMVIDTNTARLYIETIDTELRVYIINDNYTAWEIQEQLRGLNPESIPCFEKVLNATIIHPSLEYGRVDDTIIDETNHYIKNAIASLFIELAQLGVNGQLQAFKEILETSIIETDTIEDARACVKRYNGKSVTLREITRWSAPNDMFPVASTINIIKELNKLMDTWETPYFSTIGYKRAYARFQMGLVELAQRELSLPEMNYYLTGATKDDITTTESTFSDDFRQSAFHTDTNPYLNDTISLMRELDESFLSELAEKRKSSIIVIEPNKLTTRIENDVQNGEYKISIKATVPESSW